MGAGRSLIPNGNSINEREYSRTQVVLSLPYDPFGMLKRILAQNGVQMDTKPSSKSASYLFMAGRLYTQSQVIDTIRAPVSSVRRGYIIPS
jgi:hypothetical protein